MLVPLAGLMPATAGATTAPAAAPLVDARTATLTSHPSGLPEAGSAQARRIASAKVTQDLVHDRLKATITLRATPTSATNSEVRVEFGNVVGTSCHGDVGVSSPTYTGLSSGFTRSGRTITLNKAVSEAGYMDWDCAFVATTVPGGSTTYDAVLGELKEVLAKPKLTIPAVQLLRKNVKKVKLVPKVWTVLEVKVKNPSRVSATKVVVRGGGKGLRVKNVKLGKVHDDSSASARVRVKLTRKKTTTLTLKVTGSGGTKATRKVRVSPTKAPTRAVSGTYKSKDGRTRFTIKKGRLVGFYTQQWTTCGGYPDFPTTSWVAYDFPRTAVPRSGIVDARQKHRLFTAGLQMKVVGKKVTRGHFFYSGPNRCFASSAFTARRVGK
ncbi:hypothetical protein ASG90_14185 [Nocardioides sp. Soil797]|nr:hypothetical protein ASG90_14185 [Nocardioides sp. Soil797]